MSDYIRLHEKCNRLQPITITPCLDVNSSRCLWQGELINLFTQSTHPNSSFALISLEEKKQILGNLKSWWSTNTLTGMMFGSHWWFINLLILPYLLASIQYVSPSCTKKIYLKYQYNSAPLPYCPSSLFIADLTCRSPRNENFNLLAESNFLIYLHIVLNKNWKMYWSKQTLLVSGRSSLLGL
jgi:hypothetical protein